MFAVLEQIQRAALGRDVNTTIADKYLTAATGTPLAILTMLRKNATHKPCASKPVNYSSWAWPAKP